MYNEVKVTSNANIGFRKVTLKEKLNDIFNLPFNHDLA